MGRKHERIESLSVEQTREVGARIGAEAQPGDVYALNGDLGAGKTEFVRGFVSARSKTACVHSPSFSILNIYDGVSFPIYHFDFYRMSDPDELIEIGLDDYLRGDGVCLVEWADRFGEVLPEHTTTILFGDEGPGKRSIEILPS